MNCADFATVSMAARSLAKTIIGERGYAPNESGGGPNAYSFRVDAENRTKKAPFGAWGLQTDTRTVFGDSRLANAFDLDQLVYVFEGAVLVAMGDYRFGFFQAYAA